MRESALMRPYLICTTVLHDPAGRYSLAATLPRWISAMRSSLNA
jgi:hypothetical protein